MFFSIIFCALMAGLTIVNIHNSFINEETFKGALEILMFIWIVFLTRATIRLSYLSNIQRVEMDKTIVEALQKMVEEKEETKGDKNDQV